MMWLMRVVGAAAALLLLAGCTSDARDKQGSGLPSSGQSNLGVLYAYDLLHGFGLRVALSQPTEITSLYQPQAKVDAQAAAKMPRGSAVTLTPEPGPLGSPALMRSDPHYRVPDFRGRRLSAATNWADRHHMFWAIPRLPALPASSAKHLFDAYRVVEQQPKPGMTIGQGVKVGKGFKPTPLTLTVVRG